MNMLKKLSKAVKAKNLRYERPELSFTPDGVESFQRYVHSVLSGITEHYDRMWLENKDRLYAQNSRAIRDEFLIDLFMMELEDQLAMTTRIKELYWEQYDKYINREIIHQVAKLFDRTESFLLLIVDGGLRDELIPRCHGPITELLAQIRGKLTQSNLEFLARTVAANKNTRLDFVRALPRELKNQLLEMGS